MDIKELNALLSLLDDPDKNVYQHVREKLLSIGNEAIPALENVWENSFDVTMQTRLKRLFIIFSLILLSIH
ncbi:MAG TPA: hypothetical protein VFL70_02680 [Bacteroidia bacterium]|nr:hypothetical protein [Bacteroidia bacterium]